MVSPSSNSSSTDDYVPSPLESIQRMIDRICVNDCAYGVYDFSRLLNISNASVESDYEICEDQGAANATDGEYFSAYDYSVLPPETDSDFMSATSSVPDFLKNNEQRPPKPKLNGSFSTALLIQSTPIKLTKQFKSEGANISYPAPLRRWGSEDDRKIAHAVHELVFDKYQVRYKTLLEKIKKRALTAEENKYRLVIAELEAMFANNDHVIGPKDHNEMEKECQVSELPTLPVHEALDVEVVQRTSNPQYHEPSESIYSEYDEHHFLELAIGDELSRCASYEESLQPTTTSIDTDDVSALLSSKYTIGALKKRVGRKIKKTLSIATSNSYYEGSNDILCNLDDCSRDLVGEPFRYSYTSYEDITNLGLEIYSDKGKKEIKKHIMINETIISQTEKMLNYGLKKTAKFIGSFVHLEGERIFLVSKMRRETLIDYLYRMPETREEAVARVTIENLRCILNTFERSTTVGQHYVCILQHKTTIYSTRIAVPNRLDWIDFGGFFVFNNVSNTFSIKIQLYCITIPKACPRCFILPFARLRPKLPMMKLVGEAHIGLLNIKSKKFALKNKDHIRSNDHKLTATIEASMCWPETLKIFLTVGTGKIDHAPLWNRRWCVLEEATLKYYNYPSDEIFCPPLGCIDLHACKALEESDLKYLNRKTIRLYVSDSDEIRSVLLSPDTNVEYEQLERHLRIILRLVKQWNSLSKFK